MLRLLTAYLLVISVLLQPSWTFELETPRNLKISGGYSVTIDAVPYMAALLFKKMQWCGATIIDDLFVLTAAHCLEVSNTTEDWKVLLGSDHLNNEGLFIDVEKILCNEEFNDFHSLENDICLLKLKEKIPIGCFWSVEPIALPQDDRVIYGNVVATVTGWAFTEYENHISNELQVLQQASVPMVSNECCSHIHKKVTDRMICAGAKGRNFCLGDGGGPLVLDGVLIGVASQNAKNCHQYPGVYTNVARFVEWIHDTIRDN